MSAITPVTDTTTAGYVIPNLGVYGGEAATSESILTEGKRFHNRNNMKLRIYYFSSIGDGDTWTSGIKGIIACAFQADNDLNWQIVASPTVAATGVVTFQTNGAARKGWLWVLSALS